MLLPFSQQQCFFVAIFVFIVVGFQRGWRRELVSLVFVLLATFLVRPNTSDAVKGFFGKLPGLVAYLTNQPVQPATGTTPVDFLGGPFWSLVIFAALVFLGYYVGNKVFPRPNLPQERFMGIVPAIISGAFILSYLTSYVNSPAPGSRAGQLAVSIEAPDPANFIAIIIVIAIVALVVALIASRARKAPAKK